MRGARRWCCQGFQAAWPATNRKVLGKNWKLSFRFTAAGQWERGRKSERKVGAETGSPCRPHSVPSAKSQLPWTPPAECLEAENRG